MATQSAPALRFDATLLSPGLRIAVGVSGGADSLALLRALHAAGPRLGLVLSVAHLHHGLRGAEADQDLAFVRDLAERLGLAFHEGHVDVAAEAKEHAESIEEAARRLRYAWFGELLKQGPLDAVATAHTRDDQAETVCAKFLRGAWTEGLSGIHPTVLLTTGRIVRPLLCTSRAEVEAYLIGIGQEWREDSSNGDLDFTRNRIRHELLPTLAGWNPKIREHLAQMATLARDEEAWWQDEVKRLAAQVLMEGRPVRGGGRSSGSGLAVDAVRLAALPPALARRLLRHAAGKLGAKLDFRATEVLLELALEGRAGQRRELAQGLRAERTPRELRLMIEAIAPGAAASSERIPEYVGVIPCELRGEAFEVELQIALAEAAATGSADFHGRTVRLRNWKPGDRVRLRYSGSPRKVKEVLERLHITGTARAIWPVLELDGAVVWMKGVELEPSHGISILAKEFTASGS